MKNKTTYIIFLMIWSLGPFLWQVYTSFSSPDSILNPFTTHLHRWTLENYIQVLNSDPPFIVYLRNSTIVGITSTIITLVFATPAAYAMSNSALKLKKEFKSFLLLTALFPYVLLFLSLLEIARSLNIGNNLFALSIPYSALSMPLAILLLSSAFKDLPKDLDEAARLEGLSLFQRLKWVLIPLIAPAISSTGIIVFLFSWNEYPIALTWISKASLMTIPVAIARIAGSSVYSVPYGAFAAATVLGSIPLIILVIIFQRQIISGLTQGAIKG